MKGPFHSPPRPDPSAPWTAEEIATRLETAFTLCKSEYHYTPSADDWTALRKACSLIRTIKQVIEATESVDLDYLRDNVSEQLCRALDLVTRWP